MGNGHADLTTTKEKNEGGDKEREQDPTGTSQGQHTSVKTKG
jgi:hypothetical protein